MLTATTPKPKDELLASNSWADVRDVALGHVLALERPAAGGERIVVAGGERAFSLMHLRPANMAIAPFSGAYIWQEWRKSFECECSARLD